LTISAPGEASGPVTGGRRPILIGGFCCACASVSTPALITTAKLAAAHKKVFLLVSITRLPDLLLFPVFLNRIGSFTPVDPALAHLIGLGHDPDVITYH
jgi:hypothetical protein